MRVHVQVENMGYTNTNPVGDLSTTNSSGGYLPTNTGGYLSTNTGGYLPTNTGGYLPTNHVGYLPTNHVGYLPTNPVGDLPSTNSPVGDLPAAVTNHVRYLPTTKYNPEGGHALMSSHPAEMDGALHGDVWGGHAQLGALPEEGRHQGASQPQHDDGGDASQRNLTSCEDLPDGGGDPAAHEMRGGHAQLGAQPDEGHQGDNQPHHLQIPTKQEDDLRNFIFLSQILV